MAVQQSSVLFLCTGNYYRSRFAELLFNARAPAAGLNWWASSRGLALEKGGNNVGPISPTALLALQQRGIVLPDVPREPLPATDDDFRQAALIIALKEDEHRPYVESRYPRWIDRVQYWHIRDVTPTRVYDPLHEIDREISVLIGKLTLF